ncbi:TlpA family protein disulfide reductase [Rubrivivax gelatinosus]|uniref:Alkyl hydroperoxide reductase n=1 Tax=Rubrivivax gelatinosus TaxID=28068 RepID=A0ABS1DT21_RUBGE|nr:TlpA disulfide reductase family protein [Rubrivivax gelatinosus]MBK1712628.1 alkyl hydroperoxide reductase [Rubrivivax gelatinosus]
MIRRALLAAAVGGVGAGLAWRYASGRRLDPGEQALWASRLPRPDGSELALAELHGRPLIVNFWAPWCPPCVQEMPELDRLQQRRSDVVILGIAIDQAEPVRKHLQKAPVSYPIVIAGFGGVALSQGLGNPGSGLPYTVLMGSDGRRRQHKFGETTAAELEAWLS